MTCASRRLEGDAQRPPHPGQWRIMLCATKANHARSQNLKSAVCQPKPSEPPPLNPDLTITTSPGMFTDAIFDLVPSFDISGKLDKNEDHLVSR